MWKIWSNFIDGCSVRLNDRVILSSGIHVFFYVLFIYLFIYLFI